MKSVFVVIFVHFFLGLSLSLDSAFYPHELLSAYKLPRDFPRLCAHRVRVVAEMKEEDRAGEEREGDNEREKEKE